ncbi:MAG: hypothetical protein LBP37_06780 [Spirochaetaceae bacterium]|jgi:hypothetical protein|nr:hypothetical protein [Spirochaetaceae bacterium]
MTISEHSVLLKTGIGVSLLAAAAFAVFAINTFPLYSALISGAATRSAPAFIVSLQPEPAAHTALASAGIAVLFALVTQFLLYYFFEKTQSIEIRLFSIFLFSFVFEILRIALPVKEALDLSGYIPVLAMRLVVFGRFYGLFALLAAGLYASGLKIQEEEALIFPIVIIALLFAFRIPLDTFNYDTSLYPVTGFQNILKTVNAAIVIMSIFSFASGAYTRGIHEYYFTALGILAAALGRTLLFMADTWLILFPGLVFLVFGTWLTGSQLRRIYLWV